eukprot:CAMPEP_0180546382 /NCGR_PEP_ID=MMETSP1036_2-20121128/70533_1 /TAXON_ID=632150 /ORGANISM="Azadinium spinosum, Strain 3D9" /LENGTH=135 /DNA_ID=CAMNT_0022561467 /DNA_START=145 /DNA_END=548 /DNA_ORIENTATION=+
MDYMPAHDGSLAQDSKPEPIEVNPPTYVMMGGGYSGSGDQADLDNHANQCNPNNDEYNGYQDNDDSDDSDDNAYSQADLDNHANQLNPNNDLYQGDDACVALIVGASQGLRAMACTDFQAAYDATVAMTTEVGIG